MATKKRRAGIGSSGVDAGPRARRQVFDLGAAVRRVIAERDAALAKVAALRAFIDGYPGGLIGKKQLREVLE